MSMTASPPVGSTAVTMRTSPFGIGVVGQHVDVDRAVDAGLGLVVAGDRRAVRAVLVDLVGLHDLGVRVVGVDLGDDLAAVLVGVVLVAVVVEVGQDVAPVLDAVEALLRAGDPRRAGVDVVDPHPAVDEAQPQLRPGAVERDGLRPRRTRRRRSAHHWANVGRRGRHGEHAAAVDDRRRRRRAGELGDLGRSRRRPAGGRRGARRWSRRRRGRRRARLLQDQRRPVHRRRR